MSVADSSHPADASSLKRAAQQTLRDLRLAGVTHLPGRREAASTARAPSDDRSQPIEGTALRSDGSQLATLNSQRSETEQMTLEQLAACVAGCSRCRELADTRTQTVFGVGDPHAKIMFIGEAPGADEDRQGEPFVGRAGQLLDRIIAACKMKREEIYICNILKCRPPGNRNPTDAEAANCREYLDGQIRNVQPEYIVCWGSVAAKNLLGRSESIGKMRGRFYTHGDAKVLCTYHPSYLLRNPAAKKDVWDDMKLLFRDMGVEL